MCMFIERGRGERDKGIGGVSWGDLQSGTVTESSDQHAVWDLARVDVEFLVPSTHTPLLILKSFIVVSLRIVPQARVCECLVPTWLHHFRGL